MMSLVQRFNPYILNDSWEWMHFCEVWYEYVRSNVEYQRFGQAVYNGVPEPRLATEITRREMFGESDVQCDPFDNDGLVEVFTQEIYKLWKEQQ